MVESPRRRRINGDGSRWMPRRHGCRMSRQDGWLQGRGGGGIGVATAGTKAGVVAGALAGVAVAIDRAAEDIWEDGEQAEHEPWGRLVFEGTS